MPSEPDRVYIAKQDRALYDKLALEVPSDKMRLKDWFLLAVATGLAQNVHSELESREDFVRAEYFTERDMSLMKAAAFKGAGSIDAVQTLSGLFGWAEKYAHAGIQILSNMIDESSYEGFDKLLEEELVTGAPQNLAVD